MKMIKRTILLLTSMGIAFACSTDTDDSDTDGGHSGGVGPGAGGLDGAGGAPSGPAGGSTSTGGTQASTGGEGSGGVDPGMGGLGGMGGEPGALPDDVFFSFDPSKDEKAVVCAAKQLESTEILLDMFIILDKSGSMRTTPPDSDPNIICSLGSSQEGSRWCNAITALNGFFTDPSSVGMGVAYTEFASTGCDAFAQLDLPFGLIEADDGNGQLLALNTALTNNTPNGGTATEGAVDTLIAETTAHVPGELRKAISILITDGFPGACENGNSALEEMVELNALLKTHYETLDIPTFIIGMDGANVAQIEALAVSAGAIPHTDYCIGTDTDCSYYSVGDGDPTVFMAALDSIRSVAIGCEYAVPQAEVGLSVLDTLEVKFTQDADSDPVILDRVDSEADCLADSEYWIDASGDDAPIVKLCPDTCDLRSPSTAVDLALVCEGT